MALLKRNDSLHNAARTYYEDRVASGDRLLTTDYVVDETATRLHYRLDAALVLRRALDEAIGGRRLRLAWIDEPLKREAWRLLERHADVELSLTDATSAVVARRAKVREVFGFDADFRALDVRPTRPASR